MSDKHPRSCVRNGGLKALGKAPEATILGWLPALDGLRALAILAVLIHHGNTIHFSNWAIGNSGVAILFSISGFSITTTFFCSVSSEFGPPIF